MTTSPHARSERLVDLYLVRHAIADTRDAARWPDDSKRPLTETGAQRFRSAARGMSLIVPTVDRMLSSPYRRAWQTAEILDEETGWPAPEPCSELKASRSPSDVVEMLGRNEAASLALVGHEPLLSSLASLLLTAGSEHVWIELKKGGVIFLELPGRAGEGAAVLRWSLSPRILRTLDPKAR
jgi:phosphohistidine phosphatase